MPLECGINSFRRYVEEGKSRVADLAAGGGRLIHVHIHDTCHIRMQIHDTCHVRIHIHDTCHIHMQIHDTCHIHMKIHDMCHVRIHIHDTCHIHIHTHIWRRGWRLFTFTRDTFSPSNERGLAAEV